jgi:hypothetical protein
VSFSLRNLTLLGLLAGLITVLASRAAPDSLARLTDSESIPGNGMSTAACFTGDTTFVDPTAEFADSGGTGDGFEVDPTYAFGDEGGYAQNIDGAGDRHQFYDYNFSVASGCSIAGIEVGLDWWLSETLDDNSMSVELSWDGGTSWTASKTDTTETTAEHTTVLGGAADDWGHAWTASELSNAAFRVRVTSNCTDTTSFTCNTRDFYLDWVPVNVSYSL